jgi:hypothetical protein
MRKYKGNSEIERKKGRRSWSIERKEKGEC